MNRPLDVAFQLMRIRQPVGVFLLLWPCWWAIALAAKGMPHAVTLVLFALGAVIMRGAGCIVNDMADRNFDRHVERTKNRPLASGVVTIREASILLAILLFLAFVIALSMHILVLAFLSLGLVASYPFMKRITWWPQAFLGLTFNWGALMGWVAVKGDVELPAVFLYLGGVFWTLGYDTIYAHQDKLDDLIIGIKSTALKLGDQSRKWIGVFYLVALSLWIIAGITSGTGLHYFFGLLAVAVQFGWQIYHLNIDDPANCMKIFRSNSVLGLIMFLGCYV